MKFGILCAFIIGMASPVAAKEQFIGDLDFTPKNCQQSGRCRIRKNFGFTDQHNVTWLTEAGDKTDGATIPFWAKPFIGGSFDKSFIKAAVIHDHYCDRHVRTWRETHLVFYEAMIASHVPVAKAKLMYYAVYLGGPKWADIDKIPGKKCDLGPNCLFSVPFALEPAFKPKPIQISRPADYEQFGFTEELETVQKLLSEKGGDIDLSELEKRAESQRPNDFFYKYRDAIPSNGVLNFE